MLDRQLRRKPQVRRAAGKIRCSAGPTTGAAPRARSYMVCRRRVLMWCAAGAFLCGVPRARSWCMLLLRSCDNNSAISCCVPAPPCYTRPTSYPLSDTTYPLSDATYPLSIRHRRALSRLPICGRRSWPRCRFVFLLSVLLLLVLVPRGLPHRGFTRQ